jgi:pyrroloquinoline quinone (PQQ) biosynthesis protein C
MGQSSQRGPEDTLARNEAPSQGRGDADALAGGRSAHASAAASALSIPDSHACWVTSAARYRLIEHPFHAAWSRGALCNGALYSYATQFWHQAKAFPSHLLALADRVPVGSTTRRTLISNCTDELLSDRTGLWLQFLSACGTTLPATDAAGLLPETTRCVSFFERTCTRAPVVFALAALFAFESQMAAVWRPSLRALRDFYGMSGDALGYFLFHAEVDMRHAGDLQRCIAAHVVANPCCATLAERGARTGGRAIWGLSDGVERARREQPARQPHLSE